MPITILDGDGVRTVDARIESDRVLVEPGRLLVPRLLHRDLDVVIGPVDPG